MPSERGALRYDAFIATLIGCLALIVSAYTAYEQHLQVRAQVWPILEVGFGNAPIKAIVANKGVGPALVRDVVMRLDGKPVHGWSELRQLLVGPEKHNMMTSSFNGRIVAAGETIDVWKPRNADGNDIVMMPDKPSWADPIFGGRGRMRIEICYCSALDECWMLTSAEDQPDRNEPVRRCPAPSADSFRD